MSPFPKEGQTRHKRKLGGREDSRERGRLKRGIFPLPITLIALSRSHIPLPEPFITLSCSLFPLSQSELEEGVGRLQIFLFIFTNKVPRKPANLC